MKAITISRPGGPEVLDVPGVEAAGVVEADPSGTLAPGTVVGGHP